MPRFVPSRPIVSPGAAAKSMPGDPVENAVRENVRLIVAKLAADPRLSAMIASGSLKIVGGVYDLDTGKVELLRGASASAASKP